MPCDKCKLPYPDEIMSELFIQGKYTKPVCGICALEIVNEHHGIKRKRFIGTMAEEMRQRAINWRKKHVQ